MRSRECHGNVRGRGGFSLLELLIVVAIISILMSMYMSTLSKAQRKAEQVAVAEGIRQQRLGRMADSANIARDSGASRESDDTLRSQCRSAYRQTIPTGKSEAFVTETLYCVQNEAAFRAYWHTLVNPEANAPLEFEGGSAVALDESGNRFVLKPQGTQPGGTHPVEWEFLSTNLTETTLSGLGVSVLYGDGHMGYVRYPGEFPACRVVAELSQRFIEMTGNH